MAACAPQPREKGWDETESQGRDRNGCGEGRESIEAAGRGGVAFPPPPLEKESKQSKGARAAVLAVLRALTVSAELAGPELMEKLRAAREGEGEGGVPSPEGQVRSAGSGRQWQAVAGGKEQS